jgi:hypothetical protein
MSIWCILGSFGILYVHLVYLFMAIWYLFSSFGMLHQDTFGNPAFRLLVARDPHFHFQKHFSPPMFRSIHLRNKTLNYQPQAKLPIQGDQSVHFGQFF